MHVSRVIVLSGIFLPLSRGPCVYAEFIASLIWNRGDLLLQDHSLPWPGLLSDSCEEVFFI